MKNKAYPHWVNLDSENGQFEKQDSQALQEVLEQAWQYQDSKTYLAVSTALINKQELDWRSSRRSELFLEQKRNDLLEHESYIREFEDYLWSDLDSVTEGLKPQAAEMLRKLLAKAWENQDAKTYIAASTALSTKEELSEKFTRRLELFIDQRKISCAREVYEPPEEANFAEEIERLSDEIEKNKKNLVLRTALARNVGKAVLADTCFKLTQREQRKVFNLLPFNNEKFALQTRLHEMSEYVDHFVIVEGTKNFVGTPKELAFEQIKAHLPQEAREKIIHIVVDSFPSYLNTAWARDFYQRDMAIRAIADQMAPEDLVILTDADEIVSKEAIERFTGEYAGLYMNVFRFFLNYRPTANNRPQRITGAIWKAKYLQIYGSSYARNVLSRYRKGRTQLKNAGWHFTSMGDAEQISSKFGSYAHQEGNKARWREQSFVEDRLARIQSGFPEKGWERMEINDELPLFIRQNKDKLTPYIL